MRGLRDIEVTPVDPTAFVTLSDAKSYLGVSGSSEDTILTSWLTSSTILIEKHIDRLLTQRTVVERIFDQGEVRALVLTHRPIISVTSIYDDETGELIANTEYRADKAAGMIIRLEGVRWSGDIRITYVTGYATIPQPIKDATLELVKVLRQDKSRDPNVVIQQSPDIGATTYKGAVPGVQPAVGTLTALPDNVVRLLMPYMRRWA